MHGFSSATVVNDIAAASVNDPRPLTALYVGDFDPSGLYMSEVDLPTRIAKYGGVDVQVKRIALVQEQLAPLPSFPSSDKRKDLRYAWFRFDRDGDGERCWEIDALDPRELRDCVEAAIKDCILDPKAWERDELICEGEKELLERVLGRWADIVQAGKLD